MQSFPYYHSKRGFTITELFVCVLLVFVAGVAIYPALFCRTHCTGRPATCLSNQKQIALAFLQYIQDYDDRFPSAMDYVTMSSTPNTSSPRTVFEQSWGQDNTLPDGRVIPGLIGPYIKSTQTFIDPDGQRLSHGTPVLEYMYNDLLAHQKQTEISNASLTVLTIDSENRWANAGHAYDAQYGPFDARFNEQGIYDVRKGASIRTARLRHHDGANLSVTDGHVKWLKGGADDPIFFPPRDSASVSAVDTKTKKQIGPKPGGDMQFNGSHYEATFHIR